MFTFAVIIVLLHTIVVFEFILTRELKTVLEGTAPKKVFSVIFFDVGVPFGLSITNNKSSEEGVVSAVN